jgi:hypothetical protein
MPAGEKQHVTFDRAARVSPRDLLARQPRAAIPLQDSHRETVANQGAPYGHQW